MGIPGYSGGWGGNWNFNKVPRAKPATPVMPTFQVQTPYGYSTSMTPGGIAAMTRYNNDVNAINYGLSGFGYTTGSRGGGGYGGGGGGGMSGADQRTLLNYDILKNVWQREGEYDIGKRGIDLLNQGIASDKRMLDFRGQEIGIQSKGLDVESAANERQIRMYDQLMGLQKKEYGQQQQRNTLAQQGAAWERDFGLRRLQAETGLDLQELQASTGLTLRELAEGAQLQTNRLNAEVGSGRSRVNEATDLGLRTINWNEKEDVRNRTSQAAAAGAGVGSGFRSDLTNIGQQAKFGREKLTDQQTADLRDIGIQKTYGKQEIDFRKKYGTEEAQMRQKYGTMKIENLRKFETEKIKKSSELQIKDLQLQSQIMSTQFQAQQAQTREEANKLWDKARMITLERDQLGVELGKLGEDLTQIGIAMGKSANQSQALDLERGLRSVEEQQMRAQYGMIQG